jgi:hypothetical protein
MMTPNAWKVDALRRELEGLDRQIAGGAVSGDRASRSALSFIRQLRRDRRETLSALERRPAAPGRR